MIDENAIDQITAMDPSWAFLAVGVVLLNYLLAWLYRAELSTELKKLGQYAGCVLLAAGFLFYRGDIQSLGDLIKLWVVIAMVSQLIYLANKSHFQQIEEQHGRR